MVTFTIQNKDRRTATIIMLVAFGGMQYRKSIGIGVPPEMWNAKKRCARITSDYDGSIVNARIALYEGYAKEAIRHFTSKRIVPTRPQFTQYINGLISPRRRESETLFCSYLENIYIPRYSELRAERTVKSYRTILTKIREYETARRRTLTFEDIGMSFYTDFQRYFYSLGYKDTYFGTAIKIIKQVYTEARDVDRLHTGTATGHRDFDAISRPADTVYLTRQEIDAIAAVDLSPEALRKGDRYIDIHAAQEKSRSCIICRNFFLIGCYTGLRVSDLRRLDKNHIVDGFIRIRTKKTKKEIVVPVHPVIQRIIDSGFDLSHPVSDQKINQHIKDICKLAGIKQDVVINVFRAGKMIEEVHPKYELVTNHTARRSFATNAIRSGIPTHAVMMILGHSSEATTMRYIKQSAQENADDIATYDFFKK